MKNNASFDEAESTRRIKLGAFVSYISISINILAGLLYTPWMIQQIGQENFGIYTLAMSLISMFLIDFGLSAASARFVSKYHAVGDQESINNILGIVYKTYILIDFVISAILVIVYFNISFIYRELTVSELSSFRIVYIIVAMFSVISFPFMTLNGILTSYEKFTQLKLCDLLNKIVSVILILLALANGFGLYALVTANAVSGLVVILIKIIIIKKETSIKVNFKYNNKKIVREIFSFSVWSGIANLAQRFIFTVTPSVLGMVSGSISIAVFGIASSLEGYVYTFGSAINGLFLPKVTRIVIKENSTEDLLELMVKIGRIQLVVIGLITIGFITIGKDFIILWMGKDYIESYYSAILLILPSIIYLPQQIGNTAIIALNKVKFQAYVFLIMGAINIILTFVFSRLWSAFGAAVAIFISYSLRNIGMNIIYYKVINVDIFKYFKECHVKLLFRGGL